DPPRPRHTLHPRCRRRPARPAPSRFSSGRAPTGTMPSARRAACARRATRHTSWPRRSPARGPGTGSGWGASPRRTQPPGTCRTSSARRRPKRSSHRPGEQDAMSKTRRVEKPWGYELIWAHTDRYVGKTLHITQGHKLSLQYHNKKDETIHVQSGRLLFVVDEGAGLVERELKPGESYHVKPLTKHRMVALTDCDVLEVSTPELDDV